MIALEKKHYTPLKIERLLEVAHLRFRSFVT